MDCEVVDQQKRQYCKIETWLTKDNQEKDYIYWKHIRYSEEMKLKLLAKEILLMFEEGRGIQPKEHHPHSEMLW